MLSVDRFGLGGRMVGGRGGREASPDFDMLGGREDMVSHCSVVNASHSNTYNNGGSRDNSNNSNKITLYICIGLVYHAFPRNVFLKGGDAEASPRQN